IQPALLEADRGRDAGVAARSGVPRRRRSLGARAAARAPRPAAPLAALPARRAARLGRAGADPVGGRVRAAAAPRLVAAGLLGDRARRAGGRQGLPAPRALAAALLPRG